MNEIERNKRGAESNLLPKQRLGKDYRGKRYVNLLRCSNLTQADTSPNGQKLTNDALCAAEGMIYVDDIYAEGVSGSQTFNREDIDELLRRHKETDFDVVVVHDLSRLTRGGIRHGNVVEDRLKKAGIELISSTDMIPDGPEGDLIKSVKHYSNQMQGRSISLSVARGLSQSLAKSSRPAASRTPYGLDRLYFGPDGKARMLVRWNGMEQQLLNPDTLELVSSRIKPARSKPAPKGSRHGKKKQQRFKGYLKQADESSRLVPGAKDRLDTLIWIFTAYFIEGWGYHRIVQNLNDRAVPGAEGGRWCMQSVRNILFNPIYLGVEVRHRWTRALYNMLGPTGTTPAHVDQDKLELEGRSSVPHVERPRDEWKLVDVPHLKDLLSNPLREIAIERVMKRYDANAIPHPKKGVPIHSGAAKHKQMDSPFVLTHILRSKQTGKPMRGEVSKKKSISGTKIHRYYFDGSAAVHGEKGINIRRVRAEPVEEAVLNVIRQILSDSQWVSDAVEQSVSQQLESAPAEKLFIDELESERQVIIHRLQQVYNLLGKNGCEAVAKEIEADQHRLDEIEKAIKADEQRKAAPADIDITAITRNVRQHIAHLVASLKDLRNWQIKRLLAAMVEDLTIDLTSYELNLKLAVPRSFLEKPDSKNPINGVLTDGSEVRLESRLPWPLAAETNHHHGNGYAVGIGHWKCMTGLTKCYHCSRVRHAA